MAELEATAKKLLATTWSERKLTLLDVREWLSQFAENPDILEDEQLHAMYLLTHFLYFDQGAIRELLRSVFRDFYRTPALHSIRRLNGHTLDTALLEQKFQEKLSTTRFLGVGNPSESGVHLLYYFRQENDLSKSLFINSHEMFRSDRAGGQVSIKLQDPTIRNYVFIDDLCGSGSQAKDYLQRLVGDLKALDANLEVSYFVLFATPAGLQVVRDLHCFDNVASVFELDDTFRCLGSSSRIFNSAPSHFDRLRVRATCQTHGQKLWPTHPLGYKDGQLLLGLSYNTPDNTLPIFWMTEPWRPVFKRYHKDYG